MRFIYVMDPMCAWCYGFTPELEAFLQAHSDIDIEWVMGGLAPDNDQPMTEQMRATIADYWHQIEAKTNVTFNHDYWRCNTPYRSTYLACRAVIVASDLLDNGAEKMVNAIQIAYYQKAQNPSLENTLIECAAEIGLDEVEFVHALNSEQTQKRLTQHLGMAQQLHVTGFPALFYLDDNNQAYPLALGFCTFNELAQRFNRISQ
ncbi:DsbA family protein [Pseudoalteromonas sp. MMG024]|uniref:DsbA family protein n=1 Tax=Pseudoalteromonas sp. MMG024 TaxID=2909980 RepID=UPI001F1A05F2|nr:DsbA family protein [Pseudoalteromonas sp. MMG024]MCF6455758.1 DsbA family protein [Pseudoalteromonas sp. MMG024]